MYSQDVNQFIMRSLVRELAGKGRSRHQSQARRLPRAGASRMGPTCMERGQGIPGERRRMSKLVRAPKGVYIVRAV